MNSGKDSDVRAEDGERRPFLLGRLRKALAASGVFRDVAANSSWLVADRLVRLGVGLFVGVWLARYIGPVQFGLWNYAIAFAALFSAFATLGLDGIVVRQLTSEPDRQGVILGSALALRIIGSLVMIGLCIAGISVVRPSDRLMLVLVIISAVDYLFQSARVIDLYFQARIESRYSVYASNGAFVVAATMKVALILAGASLLAFVLAGLFETVLGVALLIMIYRRRAVAGLDWRFDAGYALRMLRDSWPLMLAGLSVMIYMRIDQVMIGQMLGDEAVGLYSASARLSEIWYFVPVAVANSVFSTLISSRTTNPALYVRRLERLFSILLWAGIVVATIMSFAANWIIVIIYGAKYAGAASSMAILFWAGAFVGLGVLSGIWYTAENLTKYSLYRALSGCVANVVLNLFLIPRFGFNGAAVATLISQIMATFAFDAFSHKTRGMFLMKLRAFNPVRAFSAIRVVA